MIIENTITQERINLPELELAWNIVLRYLRIASGSDPAGWGVSGDADKSLHSYSDGGVDRDSEEDLGDGKEPGNDVR